MRASDNPVELLVEMSEQFGLSLQKCGSRYILSLFDEYYLGYDTTNGYLRLFRKVDRYYIGQNISPLCGVMVLCSKKCEDFNVLFSEPDAFGSTVKGHLLFGGMYTIYDDLYFSEELGTFFGFDKTTSLMVFDIKRGAFGFEDVYNVKEQLEEIATETGYKLVTLKKVNSWVESLDGGIA